MKVQDLLDIEFFEKCFFGQKLLIKDQLVFRIYASELLELIKNNLSKDLSRKYKAFKEQKRNKSNKKRSKSPLKIVGIETIKRKRETKTPEPKKPYIEDSSQAEEHIVNITIKDTAN